MKDPHAYLYGPSPNVAVGNTVVLNAGMLTTQGNYAGAPPASGSFPTFLADGNGSRITAAHGVAGPDAVPEPSTWALLSIGAAVLGIIVHRTSLV